MEVRQIDGNTFKRMLMGGAQGIRENIKVINELNVFPVPDGDTGTNMSKTIDSGVAGISGEENPSLGYVADKFARGSLMGARGNSGVILSQFFAGMCDSLAGSESADACKLAEAYTKGVERAYKAVIKPVEGTILTVFRESTEYARANINENSTIEDFLALHIEESERSLVRTKEILPVLTEADVVDSGGAGYLCIARGMYASLSGEKVQISFSQAQETDTPRIDYELFTTDSKLEFGYCTECLVRLQRAKGEPESFDTEAFAAILGEAGCDSIVALRDGDILKVHAHTKTPSDILTLCQKYGEFLNVKIENMSLQHSEREALKASPKKAHKKYGVVTVATGEGMKALFGELGADVVINGGQTGNPSTQDFLDAFCQIDADHIFVLPNNSNILLTATQAKELWEGNNVTVIPTKSLPEGYAALSVFNPSAEDVDTLISDLSGVGETVVSGEVTMAVRHSTLSGIEVEQGEYIGILNGELVSAGEDAVAAMISMLEKIEDIEDREILTLFVGDGVDDEARVAMTEALEERFGDLAVEVYIGGQEIYEYLVAVE